MQSNTFLSCTNSELELRVNRSSASSPIRIAKAFDTIIKPACLQEFRPFLIGSGVLFTVKRDYTSAKRNLNAYNAFF